MFQLNLLYYKRTLYLCAYCSVSTYLFENGKTPTLNSNYTPLLTGNTLSIWNHIPYTCHNYIHFINVDPCAGWHLWIEHLNNIFEFFIFQNGIFTLHQKIPLMAEKGSCLTFIISNFKKQEDAFTFIISKNNVIELNKIS